MTGRLDDALFLDDGGQDPLQAAKHIADFISDAKVALDIAIYDVDPHGVSGALLLGAINTAGKRGVKVRLAYNMDEPDYPGPPPRSPGDADFLEALEVPVREVSERGALMHHKYVVRDGADVLTGSTNWTDDAFGREENVILSVTGSPELAAAFANNFEHLFTKGHVHGSGGMGPEVTLDHGVKVRPYFAPLSLGQVAAGAISRGARRLRVVSPVITVGAVLGTLAEFVGRQTFDLAGAFDRTQMQQVLGSWGEVAWNRWKIAAFEAIAPRLSGKDSTPWSPTAIHDYMHAKFIVSDDEVLVGSYNLSRHGEENAENVLHIVGENHAQAFTAFADRVVARYRTAG